MLQQEVVVNAWEQRLVVVAWQKNTPAGRFVIRAMTWLRDEDPIDYNQAIALAHTAREQVRTALHHAREAKSQRVEARRHAVQQRDEAAQNRT